jgi:hypothetical protein
MPRIPKKAQTEGSTTFEPDSFFESWRKEELTPPWDNDFRKFIIKSFGLSIRDTYVYRATAEVTLLQAQSYVDMGGQGMLHAWYVDDQGQRVRSVWQSRLEHVSHDQCSPKPRPRDHHPPRPT